MEQILQAKSPLQSGEKALYREDSEYVIDRQWFTHLIRIRLNLPHREMSMTLKLYVDRGFFLPHNSNGSQGFITHLPRIKSTIFDPI
jgi:hypothetical protein